MKQAIGLGVALLGLIGFSSRPGWAQEAPPVTTTAAVPPAPMPAPAASPVALAPSVEAVPDGSVKLHVRATQPGIAFHYAKLARPNIEFVADEWTRLCLEECDAVLPRGRYQFALSYGAAEPVIAPKVLEATTPVRIEGAYTDRSQRRSAGWLVLGLGGVASVTNIALGIGLTSQNQEKLGTATIIGGVVGLLTSLVVGIPLAASGDDSSVDIRK